MFLNPAIITLVSVSLLTAAFAIYASIIGFHILRDWNLESGSERQLALERKTYLISSILAHLCAIWVFSVFFFIYILDHIHPLFTGAMCAVGSLNVNPYGYPALIVTLAASVLSGLWLILNYTDNQCPDYPLIKAKYKLLMIVAACSVCDTYLLIQYFLNMKADIITSCCGIQFNEDATGISGQLASLSPNTAKILFYLCLTLTLGAGIQYLAGGGSAMMFSCSSTLLFTVSMVSVVSFISLYIYELPTHHCPFCLLQKEYHYIGYPLYISLLTAGTAGIGVGALEQVKGAKSLEPVLPAIQRKLCFVSMIGFASFAAISTYPVIFSDFILEGYWT